MSAAKLYDKSRLDRYGDILGLMSLVLKAATIRSSEMLTEPQFPTNETPDGALVWVAVRMAVGAPEVCSLRAML
jgi:hypothetical protein